MSEIEALREIGNGFDFRYLLEIIQGVIPALICITLHELSHGFAAYKLGDDTAKLQGRLTLNPIKHLDITGLLMLLVFHVGWAKPVPVNMYKFKNPKRGMAVTALAGPVSNILIAAVFLFLFGAAYIPLSASGAGVYILQMIQTTALISIGLALFNLIPVPPLDGSKVLFSLMSDESYAKLMRYERYGMLLMVVLMATGVLGEPLTAAIDAVYRALLPAAQGGMTLVYHIFYK